MDAETLEISDVVRRDDDLIKGTLISIALHFLFP